jgi:Cu-Zn family superoxide dismutase
MKSLRVLAILLGAAVAADQSDGKSPEKEARAELKTTDGQKIGEVLLIQNPEGVLISAHFSKAPPGVHAFHLHEKGKCEGNFDSAGGHFNPQGKKHGLASAGGMHAGDLPNLTIPPSGELKVELFAPQLSLSEGKSSLLDADGSAVVLHAKADDYRTDPAGAAGGRIACGVLQR